MEMSFEYSKLPGIEILFIWYLADNVVEISDELYIAICSCIMQQSIIAVVSFNVRLPFF
jgi:hypothetical protein